MDITEARVQAVKLWTEMMLELPHTPDDWKAINDIAAYMVYGVFPGSDKAEKAA